MLIDAITDDCGVVVRGALVEKIKQHQYNRQLHLFSGFVGDAARTHFDLIRLDALVLARV